MYIPCCFEKNRWAPVAMLGILRSGAAFFNVDPGQTENWIQLMIKKLKSTIIVCSPEQYELCRGMGDEYTVIVLCDESPEALRQRLNPLANGRMLRSHGGGSPANDRLNASCSSSGRIC